MPSNTAVQQLHALQYNLKQLGPVAVAVSGGVDSMTLAVIAHRLDVRSEIFHAISPAVPKAATERVEHYAQLEGWQLKLVDAGEMANENYRSNPVNRCYYCKTQLYRAIAMATSLPLVSGTNLDDLDDYRPGLIAATEHQVAHPFVEAGIDKTALRAIARYLQLTDLAELPAAPCLSSRVSTGITIDVAVLQLIEKVETEIWRQFNSDSELSAVRCRILRNQVAVQLAGQLNIDDGQTIAAIQQLVRVKLADGPYQHITTIKVEPYQRGSAFIHNKNSIAPAQKSKVETVIPAVNLG